MSSDAILPSCRSAAVRGIRRAPGQQALIFFMHGGAAMSRHLTLP